MRLLLLLTATIIWGFGFVATRWTLTDFDAVWSNSLRFVFAGLFALPWLVYKRKVRMTLSTGVCSVLLLAALQLQTIGIQYTSLAKSGFFTVFYAIFTPILVAVIFRQTFRRGYWGLLSVALVGVALLCELSWEGFNIGDAFTLGSAVVFALHIIAIDQLAQDENPITFNLQQCLYVGVLGVPLAFILSGVPNLTTLMSVESLRPSGAMFGFLFLSLFSSIGAFSIQVYVQQETPPHIVSLIFLCESVFGALFGFLIFKEWLSPMAMSGAFLVLMSVAFVPLLTNYEKHPNQGDRRSEALKE